MKGILAENEKAVNKTADKLYKELYDKVKESASKGEPKTYGDLSMDYIDIATLFVCSAYLIAVKENEIFDKETFRKNAYIAFREKDKKKYIQSWEIIDSLANGKKPTNIKRTVTARILKGGAYKIKQYYLENYKLSDIRGASMLLNHVEEQEIPQMIKEKYIPECIIYTGGGNILALLPDAKDNDFDAFQEKLERRASEYLLTANVAYYISEAQPLKDIFGDSYRDLLREVETELNERKEIKLMGLGNCKSTLLGRPKMSDEDFNFMLPNGCTETENEKKICQNCGSREATYKYSYGIQEDSEESIEEGSDSEVRTICDSCLHKMLAGRDAKINYFAKDYEEIAKFKYTPFNSIEELDSNNVAVVYADGNNMGGLIANFKNICTMMQFSRNVKDITKRSVFETFKEENISKFEIVGLGGDDVFIILPAKNAITFTATLIEKYNENFKQLYSDNPSTLSAGIAIAKPTIPIKVMLERAEEQLALAKEKAKLEENKGQGTLAFCNLTSLAMEKMKHKSEREEEKIHDTLQPYTLKEITDLIKFVRKLSESNEKKEKKEKDKKTDEKATSNLDKKKTKLRNIYMAFEEAEKEEGDLFFRYTNAREKEENRIELPEKIGNCEENENCTCYSRNENSAYYEKDGQLYYIWKDILELLDYCQEDV
ncbi:Cas10/Cmr2 second palm domain-containing protein [Anaerosporobacter sp.]|uniref:Cas10/Cmr2 second palm domain-containing protein n=1 Tax=Anaerosporobacter sp. TaxID=1872529 RepID=UPI00286F8EE0|nr:hypothetical protein [Anaerosporobacter sp.]